MTQGNVTNSKIVRTDNQDTEHSSNWKGEKSHSFVEISGMQSKRHHTEKANKLSKIRVIELI